MLPTPRNEPPLRLNAIMLNFSLSNRYDREESIEDKYLQISTQPALYFMARAQQSHSIAQIVRVKSKNHECSTYDINIS